MTVEEFQRLPENDAFEYELHRGELVQISRPKLRHTRIQRRLRVLLERVFGDAAIVETELPFRALPENDLRAADVAVVMKARWDAGDDDDTLQGAPDIVIEVISPSNTVSEMVERSTLCLGSGSCEFWTVLPKERQIIVAFPDGSTRAYKTGDSIPIAMAGGQSLAVDAIFADR
jgi:Uma2 family endonuclease